MKLKEYYEALTKLIEEHPEALDMKTCTAADDEGNGYREVTFEPSLGHFSERDWEFVGIDSFEDWDLDKDNDVNAVCMN